MSGVRRGPFIAATWLIGLGVVFLVRQAADLSWGQAWPLFVILAGVASLVESMLSWRPSVAGIWAFTWPAAWIGVGTVLLASTTGNLGQGPWEWFSETWPYLVIGLGIWFLIGAVIPSRGGPQERLDLSLGGVPEASVRIGFGAGDLRTTVAAPGSLVDGSFTGGVVHRTVGPGRVELSQDTTFGLPWLDHASTWDVGLTAEVPLDLRVDAGAARTTLDLGDLRLRRLDLHTGASETSVRLPRAAGATHVRAETGAASLTLEVPAGVAARIRSRMALGSTHVDEARFPRTPDGYASPDYATAPNRVDIDVEGGIGSFRVVGA
ncbi:MAG: hypothetical protein WEC14_08435 [Chloroflexota bacterium]